jgi:hypothetical protein
MKVHVDLLNNKLSLPLNKVRFMSLANSKKEIEVATIDQATGKHKRVSSAKCPKPMSIIKLKKSSDTNLIDALSLPLHI